MQLTLASRRRRAVALLLVAALYSLLRRPILTWGASREEAASRLAGDELLEDADGVSTRAITIDAPAASVWPWLAQMGPSPRGGAYTYDWIENLLGLDMHSVDRVLPEYQHPQVGDTIGLGANHMRLERVDPPYGLAWRSEDGNWVWAFVVRERDGSTRLISRNRFRLPTFAARLGMLPMEPGSLVMEQKMLRGIKRRAENLASSALDPSSPKSAGAAVGVLELGGRSEEGGEDGSEDVGCDIVGLVKARADTRSANRGQGADAGARRRDVFKNPFHR
jgi:hypothetical protein